MRPFLYIFQDGEIIPLDDSRLTEWGDWFENPENRRIALTTFTGDCEVSTIFLGTDYNFTGHGPPILFETMIFGSSQDGYLERYATLEEAMLGHERAVGLVTAELGEPVIPPDENLENHE